VRKDPPEIGASREKCELDIVVGVMSLCEKQEALRSGNEVIFELAEAENRKYENRCCFPGNCGGPPENVTISRN